MIETLDSAQLAAVTGGRVTNDGADPAMIDSVTGLSMSVKQVGDQFVQAQQQQQQQLMQLFMQLVAGPPAAASPPAKSKDKG